MNVLELFAGAGGGVQAAGLLGHTVICAVEKDPYCREVLMARQEDGTIPAFPIWDDARTFDGKPWGGTVDVVSGGFPCQPFSSAGKRKGAEDERNMWPDTLRIIREVRPRVVFLENVPGLVRLYLPRVLGDLAEAGYDSEWCVLGADDVGAPHIRKRLWIYAVADSTSPRRQIDKAVARRPSEQPDSGSLQSAQNHMADDDSQRGRSGHTERQNATDARQSFENAGDYTGRVVPWVSEPAVGRVANGVAYRVDKIRALGNGQVPQCYAAAWRLLESRRHNTIT